MAVVTTASVNVIGKVTQLEGTAKAVNPLTGEERLLLVGDTVYAGEVIVTAAGSTILIESIDGSLLTVGEESRFYLSEDLLKEEAEESAIAEAQLLQRAIAEGNIDINMLEATAAGESNTSSIDDGITFYSLSDAQGSISAGFETGETGEVIPVPAADEIGAVFVRYLRLPQLLKSFQVY